MKIHIHRSARASLRGSALLITMIAVIALAGISGAILAVAAASKHEVGGAIERTRALYAAEAGVSQALGQLTAKQVVSLGCASQATAFADGGFWGTALDNKNGTWTVTSVGHSHATQRAIEAVVAKSGGGVFQNALFAGNSSGDPLYTMKFGGKTTQADVVKGNIYSGKNMSFSDNATVNGVPRAAGKITTQPGSIVADAPNTPAKAEEGVTQPIPDIAGAKYEINNDVDVAKSFKTATYKSGTPGGKAYELPQSDPAHIFRMNPSDRTANTSLTAKNDYFLEDPYETMHSDSKEDGSDPYPVKINDPKASGKYGTVDGNKKVYFIDGNLWIHNLHSMSLQLNYNEPEGMQVTFVVKGNIYMSDNLYYKNKSKDGLALIAMKDSAVTDSGNIYFGDPSFGTLNNMDAFMYAEKNFYDNNLDASGSLKIVINGNMSAGNQVAINRDYGTKHTKMTVNFDDRISSGAIGLPGLPNQSGTSASFSVTVWREVAVP